MHEGGVPWRGLEDHPWTELWMCLADILQHMRRMVEIPQKLGWTVLVFIPKGNTDTRGIDTFETLWKVV